MRFNQGMAGKTDTATLSSGTLGSANFGANDDVAGLTLEQALEELNVMKDCLEAGGEPLEGAMALWERGEALAARCQVLLDGARARFTAVTAGNGADSPRASAFDEQPF